MRSPPRWVLAVIGVAIAVAAADVAVLVIARGGSAQEPRRGDQLVLIDPGKRRVVQQFDVGRLATAVVTGYGSVWVLNRGDGTITRVDANAKKVVRTVEPDATANDISAGEGGLWFVGRPRGPVQRPLEVAELERIDPQTGLVDRHFDTNTGAAVVAAAGGAVWSTGYLGRQVRGAARSDAHDGSMRKIDIGIYGDLIAAGRTAVYWVSSISSRIARVSTQSGRLTASMPLASNESVAAGILPPNPTGVVVGGGAVWISTVAGTVLRVDPELHRVVATIHVCSNAIELAYGEGAVWVACSDDSVVRLDPGTGKVDSPIPVDGLPRGIAAGEGGVWVTLN